MASTITTINGRRCTAIPRGLAPLAAAPTPDTGGGGLAAATPATDAIQVAEATPPAGGAAAGNVDANGPEVAEIASSTSTTGTPLAAFTPIPTPANEEQQATEVQSNVEDETEAPATLSLPSPPPPAVLGPAQGTSIAGFSTISNSPPSQQSVQPPSVQTSQADNNTPAPLTDQVSSTAAASVPTETPPPPVLSDSRAASPLTTTIGSPPAATDGSGAEIPGNTASNSALNAAPNPNSNAVQSTVAVAGSVIGGVVAISVIAFLIWWWRRRMLKKRRSTLLTPLDLVPGFEGDEKGAYVISRGSIGPTPMTEKFKTALGQNMRKFGGHLRSKTGSAPTVNLDRGTSQFMDPPAMQGQGAFGAKGSEFTTKDRFVDWWSRLTADVGFNWRVRSGNGAANEKPPTTGGEAEKRAGTSSSQPDFLTLLSMDDRELDREAQRRRGSLSRKNGSSAGSADNFLSSLNLSFSSPSDNPFSDANAIAHTSAKPAPLAVSQPGNPFSDANAIPDKPATYLADMRRSRGQSASNGAENIRQPSTVYNRDSLGSVTSFSNPRNKFRSDPFDLERPELLANARAAKNSITSSTAGTAGTEPRNSRVSGGVGTGDVRRPGGAHMRSESFTSKYSSGVSLGDWSDPGPDVGPAATRWDGPDNRPSPTQGWRDRQEKEAAEQQQRAGLRRVESNGSQGSVGKAM